MPDATPAALAPATGAGRKFLWQTGPAQTQMTHFIRKQPQQATLFSFFSYIFFKQ